MASSLVQDFCARDTALSVVVDFAPVHAKSLDSECGLEMHSKTLLAGAERAPGRVDLCDFRSVLQFWDSPLMLQQEQQGGRQKRLRKQPKHQLEKPLNSKIGFQVSL